MTLRSVSQSSGAVHGSTVFLGVPAPKVFDILPLGLPGRYGSSCDLPTRWWIIRGNFP
jgi:hypothetical protein